MLAASTITHLIKGVLDDCISARGFVSNCGASVRIGLLYGAASEAPCTYVLPGRQKCEQRYGLVQQISREYQIRAFADLNDHPTLTEFELVDRVIWDVRRCMESRELTLPDYVDRIAYAGDQPGYREEGGSIVGAVINYDVMYTVSINDAETPIT